MSTLVAGRREVVGREERSQSCKGQRPGKGGSQAAVWVLVGTYPPVQRQRRGQYCLQRELSALSSAGGCRGDAIGEGADGAERSWSCSAVFGDTPPHIGENPQRLWFSLACPSITARTRHFPSHFPFCTQPAAPALSFLSSVGCVWTMLLDRQLDISGNLHPECLQMSVPQEEHAGETLPGQGGMGDHRVVCAEEAAVGLVGKILQP